MLPIDPRFARMPRTALFCALATLLAAAPALASGGYGGGSRGGGYGGGYRSAADPIYDRGKALFNGRARAHRGLAVCVAEDTDDGASVEGVRASRSSLRDYRRGTVRALAERLVHCDAPTQLVGNQLDAEEFQALLYYMNKRYALKLKS